MNKNNNKNNNKPTHLKEEKINKYFHCHWGRKQNRKLNVSHSGLSKHPGVGKNKFFFRKIFKQNEIKQQQQFQGKKIKENCLKQQHRRAISINNVKIFILLEEKECF